jgi:hypothetical protein
MWVLVFAVWFYQQGNFNITAVDDFRTEEACKAAGADVQRITPNRPVSFTCVRKNLP